MNINKILETLDKALADKDLAIWLRDEELKMLRDENAVLKEEIKKLRGNTNE